MGFQRQEQVSDFLLIGKETKINNQFVIRSNQVKHRVLMGRKTRVHKEKHNEQREQQHRSQDLKVYAFILILEWLDVTIISEHLSPQTMIYCKEETTSPGTPWPNLCE